MVVMFQRLKVFCQLSVLYVAGMALAHAEPIEAGAETFVFKPELSCSMAKAYGNEHIPVYFFHYQFPDGVQDLAVAEAQSGDADVKRVTFGGSHSTGCLYRYLAIARGGNWGWHLLWLPDGSTVVHYARLDGEAWVTSPSKKLAKQARPVSQPAILTLGQQIWVVWVEAELNANNVYTVYSDDEGRNWQDAKLITQTINTLGSLSLVEKENIPYLAAQGLAELLPLISNNNSSK